VAVQELTRGGRGLEFRASRHGLGSDRRESRGYVQERASEVRSLCEFTHSVAVAPGALGVDLHGLIKIWIEGSDKNALLGLDQMNGVTLAQVISLEHGLGDGRTGRVADGTDSGLFGHMRSEGQSYNNSNNALAFEQVDSGGARDLGRGWRGSEQGTASNKRVPPALTALAPGNTARTARRVGTLER